MINNLVFILITSTALLALSSCKSSVKEKRDAHDKKTLIIGIAQEPDSLFIPFKEMMASEEVIRAGIYTLTYFDAQRRLVPWAAYEIPSLKNKKLEIFQENGIKKMRATWHIRDNFFWPDGRPLTAEDFLFSFNLSKDPQQEILDRSVVDKIEKMQVLGPDKKTLVVTWKEPYAYFDNYAQHEALPRHLLEPLYTQAPDHLKKSHFGQTPALAGAFTVSEWVSGSHLIALKNPKFIGELAPKLDKIIWRIIPQTNTLEANLVSGSIDVISPTGLSLDQALDFEKRHGKDFDFYYTEGIVWEHVDFNLDNPILKDPRVRKAMAYASDREGIARVLFAGRQPVAHATEPPKSIYFNNNIIKYNFDPKKAAMLLDAAGWKLKQGKNIREKDNKPLVLSIMTTSGDKTRERVSQLLKQQWHDVGIEVNIKTQPAKVFFGETMRKRKFPGLAMYSWIKDPLKISDTLWSCASIPRESNNFSGQNMPGWCNSHSEAILKASSRELDLEKRIKMGQELERIFAEDLPALPLYFRVEVSVTKKGLKNWKPTGMAQPVSWNAHEWHW